MKLGSWLIARGRISGVQLKRALLDQSFYGGHLSTSLIKLGYLDERTLGEYLSDVFQVPYAPASRFQNTSPEILRMVPRHLAEKHQIVPLAVEGRKLHLAMMNPRDLVVADEVAFLTGLQVEPWVSSENLLLDALERLYQIPRPVRETIPLADRADELPGAGGSKASISPPPARRAPLAAPGPDEMGLDGHPLSAAAEPPGGYPPASETTFGTMSAGASPPVPRSILEWREQESPGDAQSPPPTAGSKPAEPEVPGPLSGGSETHVVSGGSASSPPGALASGRVPLALVPPPQPPITLEEVAEKLRKSDDRDGVFDALLGFCAQRFRRTAIFVVIQEKVMGWSGRGEDVDPARIRATVVPFSVPSIFSYFRMGSDFYFGPVPDLPANQQFYRDLALTPPDRVLLIPIQIKGRLIALLYGDNGTGRREEPDIALYRRLSQKASLALEILILRSKIAMV